ncbi:sensor histidine kinase [Flavobacterium subsaxonicum]|uniref:histidine kinase n=1 Tax=Flavobacterium subsaxonicum WB 4.1-42 = DSM 21790 TaxID=1121898 RepID=A0A0A2MGU8_9FLAO|nr:HAMP domain-containing sensor histidine kinase [Flavobacterium subsaxonicum]KGO91897.1 histidine kinase [Flavobacterium subsaxonicum WB 4.1-42 = DSM 21790]
MNKTRFRLLVFFMSLSLIGIILVQLYWVNSSLKNNEEQFKFHIQQVLGQVTKRLEKKEGEEFYKIYSRFKDSTGRAPSRTDLLPLYDKAVNKNNDIVIYSDQVTREYDDDVFFDKDKFDDVVEKKSSKNKRPDAKAKAGEEDAERRMRFTIEGFIKDYREYNYLENWISKEKLQEMLSSELVQSGVKTPFEFGIYNDGMQTKIRSANLKYDPSNFHEHKVFDDNNGGSNYRLLVSFPEKKTFLFSSILGITSLSLIFTLIIIIAYLSAINQLIKQKNISEIKTDFINNMTHEFKTPIATINLALDAIKNPKIFDDKEKVQRYLQMIREENKRMHAQVENVLQISKLDKKELEITKEQADVHDVIEGAIEHVHLIIEARHGSLTRHFDAQRTTALLNDVHFTNVLVNILDNAIKYSPDEPVIDIYTENVKDFILIKISDKGLGMNKITQKRIFEKFYREHTGDIHNVKGHGLGLAYVKRIVEDHNCHIYVESEKGRGSTFIIKMPLIN